MLNKLSKGAGMQAFGGGTLAGNPRRSRWALVVAVLLAVALMATGLGPTTPEAQGLQSSDTSDVTQTLRAAKVTIQAELGIDSSQNGESFRIVNGREVDPYEFPATLGLIQIGESDYDGHICGATAIDDTWALTAAHCVEPPRGLDDISTLGDVLVGGWYLPLELGRRISICEVQIHPSYDPISAINDIALLRLCEPHYTRSAALPTVALQDAAGVMTEAVGWGFNENQQYTGELNAASIPIQETAVCDRFANTPIVPLPFDPDIQLCAGGSIDACVGDSGGPLYNRNVVVGITSFGDSPCDQDAPGVFTRVSAYVPWIQGLTGIVPGVIAPGVPCDIAYATHVGTDGNDSMQTAERGDVVALMAGDDDVNTGDGTDIVCGGDGDDLIGLGDGPVDIAFGGEGDDVVYGQAGVDQIDGGPGDDRLRGGAGNDLVAGGEGADDLNGGRDDDEVLGGPGDDLKVRGGPGNDIVDGGEGNDVLVAGNGGEDMVYGGPGDDPLVTGGPRPDMVSGGPGDDVVKGHKGADTLHGDAGDDELEGGPQADTLDGGDGVDKCTGGTTGGDAPEGDTAENCEGDVASVP